MSMAKASEVTGITKPKIAHLEMGRQQQSREDIEKLAAYGVGNWSVNRLVALSERTDDANWWAPWADVLPVWLTTFVGLERIADRLFTYEPTVIPGLLQTLEYATAITEQAFLVRADHTHRFVSFREARAPAARCGRQCTRWSPNSSWAGCGGNRAQRTRNAGLRFARKAATPS